MFGDDIFFDGKENHVWMGNDGFRECKVGDCFEFGVEVYRSIIKEAIKNEKNTNRCFKLISLFRQRKYR